MRRAPADSVSRSDSGIARFGVGASMAQQDFRTAARLFYLAGLFADYRQPGGLSA